MEAFVIGAGPAGLTAAYELNELGVQSTILEADDIVGGISRTINYLGYRFDIGGHRFFSKVSLINELWHEMLGEQFLLRPRLSRIHYDGHFFDYPLKVTNAFLGLGLIETTLVGMSYVKARFAPSLPEDTFEQWVSNRFGRRLYEIFFKTYTEKVWGMPCSEISAEWATQRIKNLSLMEVLRNTFGANGRNKDGQVITTLIEQFRYPRFGPGMMWEKFESSLRDRGVETFFDRRVDKIQHNKGRVECISARSGEEGIIKLSADEFISSMPLRTLIESLEPAPPDEVLQAAAGLRYRDFITVVLIVDREQVFPDNWIYIHTPQIKMGRIQNYKNWSPDMVPDSSKTSLGLEYFASEHEEIWSWPDEKLIELGIKECVQLGFIERDEVQDGTVFRMKKAYPIYDQARTSNVAILQEYLEGFQNLQTIGRNGQHRYNNMDHSMLTGLFAARNVIGEQHDVWAVNVDSEYHEEVTPDGKRTVFEGAGKEQQEEDMDLAAILRVAFAKLDPVALGLAVGIVSGLGLFFATVALLLKGGYVVGPRLSLLKHYLIGYQVTWTGAIIGLLEAAVIGYVLGCVCAWLHNTLINGYIFLVRRVAESKQRRDIL
ncbi:MAG: NAD(P)/FAD-dependent oxidoreductase [Planctomycetes bacterium]|nr:NAD(P)/FAD-dependent oxidoreductase [Planctomycetota bacterium]